MIVKSTTYPVMYEEPHLGNITELELIANQFEVEDWILDKVLEDGKVEDEYYITDEIGQGYTIETNEYIDFDEVYEYLSEIDEDCEPDDQKLYEIAGVTHWSGRKR